jgi:hypothetical protein
MKQVSFAILIAMIISGCAAKAVRPGAEKIFLSNEKPESDCTFIGEIVGGQGNWWTDDITSTKNLVEGSRNEMRNKAYEMGANFVHIQQIAQDTSFVGGGKIGISGNAYKCKSPN